VSQALFNILHCTQVSQDTIHGVVSIIVMDILLNMRRRRNIGFTMLSEVALPDDDNHFVIKVPTYGSDPTPIDDGIYFLNELVILVDM
jgi:hypothetical protein